jgi:hypothetical protein
MFEMILELTVTMRNEQWREKKKKRKKEKKN